MFGRFCRRVNRGCGKGDECETGGTDSNNGALQKMSAYMIARIDPVDVTDFETMWRAGCCFYKHDCATPLIPLV